MFSRDRLCQLAVRGFLIGGILYSSAALGQAGKPESKPPESQPAAEQAAPVKPAPPSPPPQQPVGPEQAKSQCDKPQTPEQRDLCQQWRMAEAAEKQAEWTRRQFWVTAAEVAGLLVIIIFTALTAKAANRSAKAAEDVVRETRKTAERELRAYTGFAKIGLDWADTIITTNLQFINHGQTPARNVQLFADFRISNASVDFDRLLPEPSQTVADLEPNGRFNVILKSGPLAKKAVQQARDGRSETIVWGVLKYKDIFGHSRRVRYRYRWDSSLGRLIALSEGNDSD